MSVLAVDLDAARRKRLLDRELEEARRWRALDEQSRADGSYESLGSLPVEDTVSVADDWLEGVPMNPVATPPDPLPELPAVPIAISGIGTAILLSGETGIGRSALMETMAYDGAFEGISSLYAGHEIDEAEFQARASELMRLRGHQPTPETLQILSTVRYVDLSTIVRHAWAHADEWRAGIVGRYKMLFLDPASAVESALGLNFEQSNHDYANFHDVLLQPLVTAGVVVFLADNIGHAVEARQRAKGASAKQDKADLAFTCKAIGTPPGVLIRCTKVRSSRAPFKRGDEWLFDRDTRRIERRAADRDEQPPQTFRPTVLMERVSRLLESASEPLSKRQLRRDVSGRNEYIDQAIDVLADEQFITHDDAGYRSLKSYREADEPQACPDRAPESVPTVPTVPQACPDRAQNAAGGCAPRALTKGHAGTPDSDAVFAQQVYDRHRGDR